MASTITVYSQPRCVQCGATYRKLDRLDVEYRVVDVSEDPAAAEMVKALGYFAAPVVVVQTPDGGEHWTGFKPDKLERAAELVRTAQSVSAVA
ncbi:glutaredoxin domain-containing protein [Isoptericola croceus]|uniref:glutaredoxin domain-containing protein n=1 Tax=Isoptericola croceus TaxID=3031406 RepID=UPI0023F71A9C|nr:glutaredoxin domain-containing protein [Isoptericola croceus]